MGVRPASVRVFETVPDGFLDAEPAALADLLGGPSLIHVAGRRAPALFVAVLLHGNEHTSLRAVQRLLRSWAGRTLPRALTILVGNVDAARHGVRRLDGQPDYNRIWPGSSEPPSPERDLAQWVTDTMRDRGVFASVDVHNNTGLNPHYGCVSDLAARTLQLAALFARTAVFFHTPHGVQSGAFAAFAPAIAIECGKSGEPANDARAAEYLDACLHLADLPAHPVAPRDLALYRTVCVVKVPDGVDVTFSPEDASLQLDRQLDHLNFTDLPAGFRIASTRPGREAPLLALDDDGRDVTGKFLRVDPDGTIRLRRAATPSMLTLDLSVIRQDCLGYLMERLALPAAGAL